jgi:hypothetical protein
MERKSSRVGLAVSRGIFKDAVRGNCAQQSETTSRTKAKLRVAGSRCMRGQFAS